MKRRALLATAGSGLAALAAGCAESSPSSGGADSTPHGDAPNDGTTTVDGTPASELTRRELPDPPPEPSPETATEFVRRYERAVLYNDLVGRAPGDDSPVQTEVSAVRTDVLAEPDGEGVLLVVSNGSARLRHENGGFTRYRSLVVHCLADGVHRLQPYGGYRCARPGVDTERDEEAAKFQLYDFTEGEGAQVTVVVDDRAGGERAFFDRYDFGEVPLVVQPAVVEAAGRFDVSFATQQGDVYSVEWTPEPGTASWWGLTAFVLPGGDVVASVLDPDVPASFESDLCRAVYD